MILYFFVLFLFYSCSPSTAEDLRVEGEAEARKLAAELKKIETKEELQRALPRVKKRFNKIGDLAVRSRSFRASSSQEPAAAGEELFIEMARLYEIPGVKEVMESAQAEALRRMDSEFKSYPR